MEHENQLNDQLADYTDAMLKGDAMLLDDDLQELGTVLRSLQRVVGKPTPPPTPFHTRLTQTLNNEWQKAQQERAQARQRQQLVWRLGTVAAVVVLVFTVLILLPSDNTTSNTGTAQGGNEWLIFVLVAVILGAIGTAYYWFQKYRR